MLSSELSPSSVIEYFSPALDITKSSSFSVEAGDTVCPLYTGDTEA